MSTKRTRVLIVGIIFDELSGSGVTMANLFREFSKDDIAVVAPSWCARLSNLSKCPRVYQLGSMETRKIFPLNLIQGNRYSGQLRDDLIKSRITNISESQRWLKMIMEQALSVLGLNHLINSVNISPKLSRWIEDFKPDVIYCQLADVMIMKLVKEVSLKYKLPIIIHTMDDWPSTINRPNLLYPYWQWKINHDFRWLINKSALLLSISKEMCREYEKRYYKHSIDFHNPINLSEWLPYTKNNWSIGGRCRLIYFGGIYSYTNHIAVRDVSRAVDYLNHHGYGIDFDIYSFYQSDKLVKNLSKFRGVKLLEPLSHNKIPELLSHYDLCVMPLNINHFTNAFAKLSMPTKASECMISGVPILIYAGEGIALTREAIKNKWAYTVTVRSHKKLCRAIVKIISDEGLRSTIAKTAINYAKNNFDIDKVSIDFKRRIAGVLK